MNQEKFQQAEQDFKGIRDERGLRANTATRIGDAFLELLYLLRDNDQDIDFEEAIIKRFKNQPIFEQGLMSLAAILVGNYVAGQSGAKIGADGKAEFESILVRSGLTIDKIIGQPDFLDGLLTLGNIIIGEYVEGLKGGLITPEAFAELKELWVREQARTGSLQVDADAVFNGNLSSQDFVSAFLGGLGWAIQKKEVENAAGEIETKYSLEIDNISVRGSLRVFEMIISQLLGENGNRFFSDMMEVDHYDPMTGKVWLNTRNGKLYNPFRVGDIIMVQQYNGNPSAENNWYVTKNYELRITAVGIGSQEGADRLDWVTFDRFQSHDDATPAVLIQEGDTFVRFDNDRDERRKGVITMMSVGDNTPYMDILYGLKTDPSHAMKGRVGKLEGIITDIFGSLDGFGAYLNNLYAVGKFYNAQTGESVNARIEGTKARLRSIYRETTYNISDDDNFVTNGFFQKDLDGWTKCNTDGSAPDSEPSDGVIGVNGSPLFVNGQLLNSNKKMTVKVEDLDGINVLHLRTMGVSQSFSQIKENGTHKVMESPTESDTQMRDVADTLYMGIRMLPLTSGLLAVRFIKEDGSVSGWERNITSSNSWQLHQAHDLEELPWDYSGSGKMVVSYTGECYIRFVALQSDAIANSKIEYATLFEQTSRKITLQASKQSADLQEAVAELSLTAEAIRTTVTNNKTAADRAFESLISDLEDEKDAREELEGEYHGTWVYQNDRLLSLMAAEFNADGTIKGYADLKVKVDRIGSTVTDNKKATDAALKKLTDDLKDESDQNDSRASLLATWQQQTSGRIDAIAAKWDSNGNLIGYSTSSQTSEAISNAVRGLASSSDLTALDTRLTKDIEDLADELKDESDQNDSRASLLATWQQQTSGRIVAIAAKWDSNGNLIGYSTTSQTADMISSTVRSMTRPNLIATDSGWIDGLGDDDTISYDIAIEKVSSQTYTMYSQAFTMQPGVRYCFMGYFRQNPGGNDEIYATTMDTDNPLDIDRYKYARWNDWTNGGSQIRINNVIYTLYYITFSCVGDASNATVYLENEVIRPYVFVGYHPSQVSVSQAVLNMTAEKVDIGIRNGLQYTGIDIENQTIRLRADKVKFTNSAGDIDDKVLIDSVTGTLHAVNGVFEGVVKTNLLYNPIKKLPNGNYTIDIDTEAYNFYMSENGTWSDVYLPSATDYSGIIFQFFYVPGTRANLGCLRLHCQSGEYIMNLPNPSDASSVFFAATDVDITRYTPIKLISNGDNWLVLAGAEGISQVTS